MSRSRVIRRSVTAYVLIAGGTFLAYRFELRADLTLGVGFYVVALAWVVAVSLFMSTSNRRTWATVCVVATLSGAILGYRWRLPIADGDGLWPLSFVHLGVFLILEGLIAYHVRWTAEGGHADQTAGDMESQK